MFQRDRSTVAGLFACIGLLLSVSPTVSAPEQLSSADLRPQQVVNAREPSSMEGLVIPNFQACLGGTAGDFTCLEVDFYAVLPLTAMGGATGNDLWGWTDPLTGQEYALMGLNNGAAFVDVSTPGAPLLVGTLSTHTVNSILRDIKVYADHAFIVSEASGHGMQIFDLTQLRDVVSPPVTFSNTAHYDEFGDAHNLAINEDSGFAYALGANTCSGGAHMIDISDPVNPVNAGCIAAGDYIHDAQCVNYSGPDAEHLGKEICLNLNTTGDTLTIVDVSNKSSPLQLSRSGYPNSSYTHQGWLTEDHAYFLLGDEGDEADENNTVDNTRTYIWDVRDLDAPSLIGQYSASTTATDHNQYVRGNFLYQANYEAGLRILKLDDVAAGKLTEVAFFDTGTDSFAWSVYPYFDSGVVIVSDYTLGLLILRPKLSADTIFRGGFEGGTAIPGRR